jgi:regulator of nucleoside diphosphate kinase
VLKNLRCDGASSIPADQIGAPVTGPHSSIYVTTLDRSHLLAHLASRRCPVDRTLRSLLIRRLWYATSVPPEAVPRDVVTMESRVAYKSDIGREVEERTLSYADPRTPHGSLVSVWTRLGIALLGLKGGCTMRYEIGEGVWRLLFIEAVRYQPEAARRDALTSFQRWKPAKRHDRAGQPSLMPAAVLAESELR